VHKIAKICTEIYSLTEKYVLPADIAGTRFLFIPFLLQPIKPTGFR
jgi:hypothetical protein